MVRLHGTMVNDVDVRALLSQVTILKSHITKAYALSLLECCTAAVGFSQCEASHLTVGVFHQLKHDIARQRASLNDTKVVFMNFLTATAIPAVNELCVAVPLFRN